MHEWRTIKVVIIIDLSQPCECLKFKGWTWHHKWKKGTSSEVIVMIIILIIINNNIITNDNDNNFYNSSLKENL